MELGEDYFAWDAQRSSRIFEVTNHVWMDTMRLMLIGDNEHIETSEIRNSNQLSEALAAVGPLSGPRWAKLLQLTVPRPASAKRNIRSSKLPKTASWIQFGQKE